MKPELNLWMKACIILTEPGTEFTDSGESGATDSEVVE